MGRTLSDIVSLLGYPPENGKVDAASFGEDSQIVGIAHTQFSSSYRVTHPYGQAIVSRDRMLESIEANWR